MYPLSNATENFRKALEIANMTAARADTSFVGSEHFIYAFLSLPACTAYGILVGEGVSREEYGNFFSLRVDKGFQGQGLTLRTQQMYDRAVVSAKSMGMLAGTAHMLYEILCTPGCLAVDFLRHFADIETLKRKTVLALKAMQNKKRFGDDEPQPMRHSDPLTGSFGNYSSSDNDATWLRDRVTQSDLANGTYPNDFAEKRKEKEPPAKTMSASAAEKLLGYGIDMTERARRGKIDPVIGRKKEIEKVVQILSRRSKNNPVLIGEPGVGKSAIMEGLSQLIVDEDIPEQLYNKTIFSVDLPGLLAGTKYRGEFEEKLKNLIEAVLADGDIVLFIDEIHTLVGAGGSSEGSLDAANILKPMLARGDLQVIGATTVEEYRKYIEKDSALERRFTPVYVEEPSEADAITILKGLRPKYEEHHGIVITDEAIEAAVKLSSRYITDRYLPDKAIDLIDESAARVRIIKEGGSAELREAKARARELEEEEKMCVLRRDFVAAHEAFERKVDAISRIEALEKSQTPLRMPDGRLGIGREHIAAVISARVRIPLLKITQGEGEKLMRLEEDLHKRIIGQHEAVSAVAKAIRRARAGLKDPSRPIGSFIFVGPTGVGKTDLCKALAESMFGSEEQMIRLDMSEYMEKQSVSKLIGAPPGYVGFDDVQTGQLTDKVRSKPYCVILFDEIEKAHPDVFNLLLQILDDGRLTDSKGRTVSFKNAVIILTSNVGASVAENAKTGVYGFGSEGRSEENVASEKQFDGMRENITKALREQFRPEFLNRLDDVIVFHRLTEEDCAKIGGKIVESLAKRLLEQKGVELTVAERALMALVKEGYDAQYGARPLKRVIQRRIEDKLSEEILLGRIGNGQSVTVDYCDGEYTFLARGMGGERS
ncbi:MAG: ATP-dependent Clp protease ATP-binding subunit [Clostridia bacterium]|nr:ATP-dependent Clp protease ATP-binding subunit [Clostridia bacterium]